MILEGGCQCGRSRYAARVGEADPVDYCHCRQCRRATGGALVAWVQVAPDRFTPPVGAAGFRSSPGITRWFCPACGTPLHMTDDAGRSVGILLGTLDQPERLRPRLHAWSESRLAWLEEAPGLPCHPRDPPYD